MTVIGMAQASWLANYLNASETHALLLLSWARDPFGDPNNENDRDRPGCEKRHCDANHAQAPHDRGCALRQCSAQRGDEASIGRNDVALAVNLDRDVRRRARFIDLAADAVLPLYAHVLDSAKSVERLHERRIIFHRNAQ